MKKIFTLLFLIIIACGCQAENKKDMKTLHDSMIAMIAMINYDSAIYVIAIQEPSYDPMLKSVFESALRKADVIMAVEKQIGGDYKIQNEVLSSASLNPLCLMGNFLIENKKYTPPQSKAHYEEVYMWIEQRNEEWKQIMNNRLGETNYLENDCRQWKP